MGPRLFSIVVPVYNVAAFLPECLDSILGQSFADIEVIAVDDASTDDSGSILDDRAASDARLRVLHLPENVGLGPARNAGIDAANGRYLLFVDSDDALAPGILAALADRIAAAGDPDVVIFDFVRTGLAEPAAADGVVTPLAGTGAEVFAPIEHPEVLMVLPAVWNKAYRRAFVDDLGLRFSAGYYEDVAWSYPALMSASRVAALDRVGYHYRQQRQGSILASRNRRHFDAFDQYDRVFAFLAAHPELADWRPWMFARMLRHFVTILTRPDRLPAALHREFFDGAAAAYRRHRPDGYRPPAGRGGVWARAFASGDYRRFRAAQGIRRLGDRVAERTGSLRRRAAPARRIVRTACGRLYYRAQLRRPVDERLAVYAAFWGRGYACSPAAIYEAARRLAPEVRGVWVVRREYADRIPAGVDFVVQESRAYYRTMAQAKFLINNVNFPHEIVKRPGTVHVQTHHGTPIKTMGLALLDHPVPAAAINFGRLMQHAERWDYVLSANRYSTTVWNRSFPAHYRTLEVGSPRNDRLVRATPDDVAAAREALELPGNRPTLLYAPTFRDWLPPGAPPPLDLAAFCERLGERFSVLVRGHYFTTSSDQTGELERRGLLRDVSDHPDLVQLLLAADVLVTDYSSVMFDYALLDRPIVVFANDWDTYVRVRGVSYDLLAEPPGAVATTLDALVDTLTSDRYRDADADRLRAAFRRRFCEFDDGHAAERVVREVITGPVS